jgi:hypothetical protein
LALALALGLLPAGLAMGAPAPPDRLVTAEVVLRLDDPAALNAVAAKLRSAPVLRVVVGGQKVREMSCIKAEKDPAGWLASRLEVKGNPKERSMTLRLVNCPRKDALALLGEVVRVYQQRVRAESAYLRAIQAEAAMQQQLNVQLQVMGQAGGGGLVILQAPVQVGGLSRVHRPAAASGPSLVLKPPRLISNSR